MVWALFRKKILPEVHEKLSHAHAELHSVKEHILSRDAHATRLEERIDLLEDQLSQLSQDLLRMQNWAHGTHAHISQQQEAFIDLTQTLSENIPAFWQPVYDQSPDQATNRPFSRSTNRPIAVEEGAKNPSTSIVEDGQRLWERATDAQRELILKMYDLGYPASYRELAQELSRSISTVKNHINTLKTKGFTFQEHMGADSAKAYLLDDRIKTFLTLKLHS